MCNEIKAVCNETKRNKQRDKTMARTHHQNNMLWSCDACILFKIFVIFFLDLGCFYICTQNKMIWREKTHCSYCRRGNREKVEGRGREGKGMSGKDTRYDIISFNFPPNVQVHASCQYKYASKCAVLLAMAISLSIDLPLFFPRPTSHLFPEFYSH